MSRGKKPFNAKRQSRTELPRVQTRDLAGYLNKMPSALAPVREAFTSGLNSLRTDTTIYADTDTDLNSDKQVLLEIATKGTSFANLINYIEKISDSKGTFSPALFKENRWSLDDQKLTILLLIALENNLMKSVTNISTNAVDSLMSFAAQLGQAPKTGMPTANTDSYFEIDLKKLTNDDKELVSQALYLIAQCGYSYRIS